VRFRAAFRTRRFAPEIKVVKHVSIDRALRYDVQTLQNKLTFNSPSTIFFSWPGISGAGREPTGMGGDGSQAV
jgi:hypothetical protein